MGCGLRRLRRSEESSPGKIYSTLRRPQVETKVGVAYTYRFLDFLLGNAEVPGWSTPCLSSVRELPGQLQDLYLEGFVLAALHPFVHPCGPPSARLQHQLYRAVLIRPNDRVEDCESRRLEMDVCQSPGQFPDTELIQGYVKKVHDAAEQGSMFVGFVQQVAMATAILGQGEGEELSLSLHSSPSSFLREEPHLNRDDPENQLSLNNNDQAKSPSNDRAKSPSSDQEKSPSNDREKSPRNNWEKSPSNDRERSLRTGRAKSPRGPTDPPQPSAPLERVELFSLFNHLGAQSADPARFYTVRVPLQLVWQDAAVTQVQAGWLDHMTQHFSSGASLVDGYFHLGNQHGNGAPPETVESVFVFQEGAESDPPAVSAFDAIVVEQWTVIHGVQVKTDYVPLLQSLALYGWRLTCVLPTPIAKSNSDGSLSTKQVLFLQRPILNRKKRETKKLSLSSKNKSNRNGTKGVAPPKNKSSETEPPKTSQTEPPKTSQTEPPKTSQTDLLKTSQTDLLKTSQTEPPETSQTELPKTSQTEPPETSQTEPPKTSQTEPPKPAEIVLPQTEETAPPTTGTETEAWGERRTMEEARRRAEREESERVGRKNDKNRQNEREKRERKMEGEVEEREGGARSLGNVPMKLNLQGWAGPGGGVSQTIREEHEGELIEGPITEQLGGVASDGQGESTNEGHGNVEVGGAIEGVNLECSAQNHLC